MAQAWHAGVDFSVKYPALTKCWHDMSNNVVIVSVPGEAQVLALESMALTLGLKHHLVVEPDLDDAVTAIALEPGQMAKRLCAQFPLALREISSNLNTRGASVLRVQEDQIPGRISVEQISEIGA